MGRQDRFWGRLAKRTMDVVGAGFGLLLLSWALPIVAVLIIIDDPGPVFFRQQRVGRDGVPFRIWKLRTMVADAEKHGPGVTVDSDPRITRLGRVLRQWKLDEFPQLLNVLSGSMSLVGPRPEVPRFVELYDEEARGILALRPGITDPASIAFRDEEKILAAAQDSHKYYTEVVMREKLAINLEYARTATLLSDVSVILRTVAAVLRRG